ncbi:signal peptidase II [Paenibacillus apiarius]|uniref:Lipoprotein signal peptidase n=1 Tax=Paenibacillus apiarius TaxID=46240 RepID=A0ABT4DLC8_9BACL|nr:signal peptidase II [Paenibacillus apiarius]MCY9513606.1 signal peptidase II [Paenibacillus apiarius]MCY9518157.1 signal peptidase II [Paenibacillus apiarius]MCY9551442.1 signal peptidase II [Paenibacillus apiarius]MCY9558596.1 signal peptidase II [Paenibacillus apiarius]MCY9684090.1 signal peptidase II [Paenibacillus apiarius]
MWYYIIALIVFLIDQGTKWIIATKLELYEQISVIGNFFLITSHRNTGAAFSILENQRWFFVIVTIIVVSGIIWYMQKIKNQQGVILPLGLSLILGGAVGNFLDRLLTGEVVDFLQFNFGSYTFPIFNIADTGICVGVGFVLLDALLTVKHEKELEKTKGQDNPEANNQ